MNVSQRCDACGSAVRRDQNLTPGSSASFLAHCLSTSRPAQFVKKNRNSFEDAPKLTSIMSEKQSKECRRGPRLILVATGVWLDSRNFGRIVTYTSRSSVPLFGFSSTDFPSQPCPNRALEQGVTDREAHAGAGQFGFSHSPGKTA